MSAWTVSKAHIDLLVHALTVTELVTNKTPDEIGREPWRENHRSVNYRYGERSRAPHYEFVAPTVYRDDYWAWNHAARCYNYQSCERPDYERSTAYRWIKQLEAEAKHRHGGEVPPVPNGVYPWGFEESDVRPRGRLIA